MTQFLTEEGASSPSLVAPFSGLFASLQKKKFIKNIATNKWLFCEGCRSCINSSLKQQSSPLMNEMPFRRMRNLVLSPQLSPDVGSPLPPTLRFRAGKDLVWLAAACVFLHLICAKSRIRKTWGGLQTS